MKITVETLPNGYYIYDEIGNAKYYPYARKRKAIMNFKDSHGYRGEHGIEVVEGELKHEVVNSTRGLMIFPKGTFQRIFNESEDE